MKQFRFTLAFIGVLLAAGIAHAQTNEHCIKAATSGNLNCLSAPDSSAAVNQQLPGTASALNQTPVGTGAGTYSWQSAATSAASLSVPYVACSPTLTPLTGTATPTIIAQCEILANTIPVGGSVDIFQLTGITGNTDTKTLQCYWGTAGTSSDPAINNGSTTSTAANVNIVTFTHIITNGTTSANLAVPVNATSFLGTGTAGVNTLNQATTSNTFVTCYGTLGTTTDTMTPIALRVVVNPVGGH